MRSIFRVVFYLRSNYVNKNGQASVMIRIYLNSERTSLGASGIFVSPELWDSKSNKIKGRTSEALQANLQLENIRAHLSAMYKKMEFDESLSVELIKSKYLGKQSEMDSIIDLFDAYIANQNKLVGISISSTTVKKYDVCKRHFKKFIEENYKRSDLFVKEVNYVTVLDFDVYLRTKARQNPHTANKAMRTFRTIILFGNKLGLFRSDPFIGYKPQSVVHNREFLTDEELMSIITKEFSLQRLSFVRDVFIFSCFTGLAYIDITMLRYGNIVNMNDRKWIMTNRKKTSVETNILLLEIPEQIISKYRTEESTDESLIFPMLSNQKTNSYLKEIADLCGIKKNLTFHVARQGLYSFFSFAEFSVACVNESCAVIEPLIELYYHMTLAQQSLSTAIPEGKRRFELGGEVCSTPTDDDTSENRGITLLVCSLRLNEKRDFELVCLHSVYFVAKLLLSACS